jgi:hypothetical protein
LEETWKRNLEKKLLHPSLHLSADSTSHTTPQKMSSPSATVHTSDLPRDTSATSTSPLAPSIHTTLSTALATSPSAIPAIETTLAEALSASGWTTNLRSYVQHLIRSGECATYNEVLLKVLAEVKVDGPPGKEKEKEKGRNGTSAAVNGVGREEERKFDLSVKESVVREGVGVVRRELEKLCTIVVDD